MSAPDRAGSVQRGEVLAGKYRVEQTLGAGGMGIVLLATHIHLEQRVAIKLLLPGALANDESVRRFIQEAKAAARIRGDHVVRVQDVGRLEDGRPYLVMEYLEGEDLASYLKACRHLALQEAVDYVLQACEAIGEAHAAGVIHRDLKPANLFLSLKADGARSIKVLDFGISKIAPLNGADQATLTNTRALMGSPSYMAPEQMRSTKTVTPKVDVWALGVILYELLAGGPPFIADTMPEVCAMVLTDPLPPLCSVRPDIPERVEAILARATEKDPSRRFDVLGFAQALEPFASAVGKVSVERIARASGVSGWPSRAVGSMASPSPNRATDTLAALGMQATLQAEGKLRTPLAVRVSASPPAPPAATLAAFGTTAPEPQHRGRFVFVGGGVGIVAAILVAALVVFRGPSSTAPASGSTNGENPSPSAIPEPPTPPSPRNAPEPLPPTTSTAPPLSSLATPTTSARPPVPRVHARPAKPAAQEKTPPASTAEFGNRID